MSERILEVNVAELMTGDVLAADVYNASGKILAIKTAKISDNLILGLKKNFINSVFIFRETASDNQDIKIDIKQILKNEIQAIIDNSIINSIKKGKNTLEIKSTLIEIINNDSVLKLLKQMRVLGEDSFKHSISVAVYSIAVGIEMKFPPHRLSVLGIAAILHDIGMKMIPEEVLVKNTNLSEEEKTIIKKHPEYGFDMINNIKQFTLEIATIILQHQERYDGNGYPNGLTNEKIHIMAKIIAACDVYDALASDRPYRAKYKRSETVEYLLGTGNFYFNHEIVKALINTIIIYPFGQWVELTTREIGIVIEGESNQFNIRPKVMIYFGDQGQELQEPIMIDLSLRENTSISIDKII